MDPQFTHSKPGPIQEQLESGTLAKEDQSLPRLFSAEPPLNLYAKLKGAPYTFSYFGLREYQHLLQRPELDSFGFMDKVRTIENFIGKEIQQKNLYNSPASYRQIMKTIKDKLNISPLDNSIKVFENIYRWVKTYRNRTAYGLR